ncbi:MAG: endoribonuclease [Myxococcota bacterium]
MSEIYQRLWDSDEDRLTVSRRKADDGWVDPSAAILLDTQTKAHGNPEVDLAVRPLFHHVDESRLEAPLYRHFIALLDNYVVSAREAEEESKYERQEINAFIDAVMQTRVAALGLAYINEELGESLSKGAFRAAINRLWFELYTNHYGGRSTSWASGFEHVFVGEGKYDRRFGGEETIGKITGYHSWIKFYLDESRQRVDFLGYNFELRGGEVPVVPDVITLKMRWNHADITGRVVAQLLKKRGGFFVGPSPACEIVMGVVLYYESLHGLLVRDRRRTTIHGQDYDLVLYRNTTPEGSRGAFIRSFFPIALSMQRRDEHHESEGKPEPGDDDRPVVTRIAPKGNNDGRVQIAAVRPRPDEGESAFVQLLNADEASVSLDGWQLRDRMGRILPLQGRIASEDKRTFVVPGSNAGRFSLSGRGGFISLHDECGLVAGINHGSAGPNEILYFLDD